MRLASDSHLRALLLERTFSLAARRRKDLDRLAEADSATWERRRGDLGLDAAAYEVVEEAIRLAAGDSPALRARAMLLALDAFQEWAPELLGPVDRVRRIHVARQAAPAPPPVAGPLRFGRGAVIDKVDYRSSGPVRR